MDLSSPLVKQAILGSLAAIIAGITSLLSTINYTTDFATRPNPLEDAHPNYDFIIVGGGSAGGVIANRLAASGKYHVLLLEAGGDPLLTENIPYLSGIILFHPMTDWMYKTVPQNNSCIAYKDNRIPWARGKSLGGTSNLNHLIYMRGNPKDFDNWATLTGDPQWNYENCLPYFKKSEIYDGNFPSDEYHGKDGSLHVSKQSYEPLVKEWIQSGAELGYKSIDPNARQKSGIFPGDFTQYNGQRWGVYDAFIKPALKRKNLKVVRYARVIKINLDSANKRATGVTYIRHGKTLVATASKEVILSSGTIGSPHLLMLSGIGPSEHLKSVGIEPKVDIPGVGQDLQDHVSSLFGPFILNETVSFMGNKNVTMNSVLEYITLGSGELSYNYISGLGLLSSSEGDPDWPNIALTYIPFGVYSTIAKDVRAMFGVKEEYMEEYLRPYFGKDANIVLAYAGLPESKGTITLQSSNPFDPPLIDPKYFSHPKDMRVMVEAFKFIVKLYEETNTWKRYNASLVEKHAPGCENHPSRSDAYYECYIRHFTGTMWHPTSTCKMGRESDPMAVLDSNLRVRKISGLRVADASIMPRITNTNTNAPSIMIGEKAADIILKEWSGKS